MEPSISVTIPETYPVQKPDKKSKFMTASDIKKNVNDGYDFKMNGITQIRNPERKREAKALANVDKLQEKYQKSILCTTDKCMNAMRNDTNKLYSNIIKKIYKTNIVPPEPPIYLK